MSYTPSTDAQNTAALAGNNQAALASPLTALQTSITNGNLGPAAFIDAILSAVAYQANDVAVASTNISANPTSFVDVPGFTTATFTIPIAKTYQVVVDLAAYTGAADGIWWQLVVSGATSLTYTDASWRLWTPVSVTISGATMRAAIALNAGSTTFKLQWKNNTGGTACLTNASCYRKFTVTS